MLFRQFFDLETCSFTYLLAAAGKAVLIDPLQCRIEQYLRLLRELGLELACAIDTHTHADHITGLGDLRAATCCLTLMGEPCAAECVSERFRDGDVLGFSGVELRALYTPGHTADSYSLVAGDRVFTGDVLLIRSTGRTDFQQGNPRASYDSITSKLFSLPDATLVYPGHDYNGCTVSTIGEERHHNPRLAFKTADEYVSLMRELKLPPPRLMDVAVPANLRCGRAS